jgi:GNAT superfamily N-acetyltransferase
VSSPRTGKPQQTRLVGAPAWTKLARMRQLTFRDVDQERWPDFERLFESRGAPKSCWCMVWRARGEETRGIKGVDRKQAIERRVRDGIPIGLLGYSDDLPVAWCSVAPRGTYRPLGGPSRPEEEEERIWSLVCFFIKRELRGEGMTTQLIQAAAALARSKGAQILEAYPVDPNSPSYRFMGYFATFERAGFRHVGPAGLRRRVMRLDLD